MLMSPMHPGPCSEVIFWLSFPMLAMNAPAWEVPPAYVLRCTQPLIACQSRYSIIELSIVYPLPR